MEWIMANKEAVLAAGAAFLLFVGTVIKLTPTTADDTFFNKIMKILGLSRFTVNDDK